MAVEQTIAELLIEIGVDVEGANDAAKKIKGVTDSADKVEKKGGAKLKKFAKGAGVAFAAVGAAAIAAGAAIFKLVDNVTSAGDEIAKSARRAGLGAEEYQRLAFAAERSGASTEAVSKAARNFTKFFNEANQKGVTPFTDALDKAGISMGQLAGMKFEDQLGVIGDALLQVEDKSQRVALAQRILGEEAGPQLASLLESGRIGIQDLGDEAERLGAVLSDEALASSEEFQDQLTNLKTTIGGVVNEVGIELIPVVREVIMEIQNWIRENKDLIRVRIKEFIEKLVPVIKGLVDGLVTVVEFFGQFVEAAGGVEGAAVSLTAAAVGMKLAFAGALGPVGLIITAFVTLLPLALKLGDRLGDVAFEMSKVGQEARNLELIQGGRTGKRGAPGFVAIANAADRRERERILKIREAAQKRVAAATERGGRASEQDLKILQTTQQSLANIQKRGEAAQAEKAQAVAIQGEAAQRSRGFEQSFAARQEAGARVREALGKRRGSNELVQQVILGELTEEAAIARGKRAKGRGRGKPKAEKKEKTSLKQVTSLEQFLGLTAEEQADVSKNLQARQAKVAEPVRPEAVLNITNNTFDIQQQITGTTDPVEIGKEAAKAIKQEFDVRLARAGQAAQTNVAR